MGKLISILVLFNCLLMSETYGQNYKNDFFPLGIGNKYKYEYSSHEDIYLDLVTIESTKIDSGNVTFMIVSLSENDSLRNWVAVEIDSLHQKNIQYIGLDTSFNRMYDTTYGYYNEAFLFNIKENKTDSSKLLSNSYTEIWQSPIILQGSSNSLADTNGFIYRYSVNPNLKIISNSFYQIAYSYDSLVFKKDVGLEYAYSYIYKGPNTPYYYVWRAKLLNQTITAVSKSEKSISDYSLNQNYPNPFNPSTTINYSIPKSSMVSIKVYDVIGREVATLVNEYKSAGNYSVQFNASSKFPSGVYFFRMQAGSFVQTKKLILIK